MLVENPYTVDAFNNLPSLAESDAQFRAARGPVMMETSIRDLFLKYQVTEQLGLTLLHRHFSLQENQLLVDMNGTATPWHIPPDDRQPGTSSLTKYGGQIRPRSWIVSGTNLVPYEFQFLPNTADRPSPGLEEEGIASFVQELSGILEENGLHHTLGICLLPPSAVKTIEVTEGLASVTFPWTPEWPGEQNRMEAMWKVRTEPTVDGGVQCIAECVSDSRGPQHTTVPE